MNCGIYLIEHVASGKVYVGSAANIKTRWNGHRHLLRKGEHHSPHLQAAWNKYGELAFVFKRLLICAKDTLIFYEQRAIDTYRAFDRTCGFNARPIAESSRGHKMSAEVRAKMSAVNKGRKASPETKALLSAMRLGKKMPEGTGDKISAAKLASGYVHSDETREKMRIAKLGTKRSRRAVEARSKLTYDQANEIRKLFATGNYKQHVIAGMFGIDASTVSNIVLNKRWI